MEKGQRNKHKAEETVDDDDDDDTPPVLLAEYANDQRLNHHPAQPASQTNSQRRWW
jgi:hypothetical protein